MIALELLIIVLVAVVFALVLTLGLGRRAAGPAGGFIFFFVLLLLTIWAADLWVAPVGPILWGSVPLLMILFIGLFFVLLFAALVPSARPRPLPHRESDAERKSRSKGEDIGLAMSVFFWILLIGLIAIIIVGHATRR